MTCIVGIEQNGKVYIGGDSAGVAGLDLKIRSDEKVFTKGAMVFGFTSSYRMGQILRYSFKIPKHTKKKNDFEYLCNDFIERLIECFKDRGYATIDKNSVHGGVFLIGYKGSLYCIQSDFQVAKVRSNYDSCGCGESYALGSLRATEKQDLSPKKRIKLALSTAEFFSAGVRSPFKIVSSK